MLTVRLSPAWPQKPFSESWNLQAFWPKSVLELTSSLRNILDSPEIISDPIDACFLLFLISALCLFVFQHALPEGSRVNLRSNLIDIDVFLTFKSLWFKPANPTRPCPVGLTRSEPSNQTTVEFPDDLFGQFSCRVTRIYTTSIVKKGKFIIIYERLSVIQRVFDWSSLIKYIFWLLWLLTGLKRGKVQCVPLSNLSNHFMYFSILKCLGPVCWLVVSDYYDRQCQQ